MEKLLKFTTIMQNKNEEQKMNTKSQKNKRRCLECDHEQKTGTQCEKCKSHEIVFINFPRIPAAGKRVLSIYGDEFISLGELDKYGNLRVALQTLQCDFWGVLQEWEEI